MIKKISIAFFVLLFCVSAVRTFVKLNRMERAPGADYIVLTGTNGQQSYVEKDSAGLADNINSVTRNNDTTVLNTSSQQFKIKSGLEAHTTASMNALIAVDGYSVYNTDLKQTLTYDDSKGRWVRTGWNEGHAIIRFSPSDSTWYVLDDTGHTPYGVISVSSTKTGNGFTINTNNNVSGGGFKNVAFSIITKDESGVRKQIEAGNSTGYQTITVPLVKYGGYSLRLSGQTTIINSGHLYPHDLTVTWDPGLQELYINHPSVASIAGGDAQGTNDYSINIIPTTTANFFYARLVPGWTTKGGTKIKFYDAAGNVVSPSGQWYFSRNIGWGVNNHVLARTNGIGVSANYWVHWRYIQD